jgi:hypothetical protein
MSMPRIVEFPPKPRVYVRAATHHAYFEAKNAVPREVREQLHFIYFGDPAMLSGLKYPMVWRAEGWDSHPASARLSMAERLAMSTRWSWPPADGVGSGERA